MSWKHVLLLLAVVTLPGAQSFGASDTLRLVNLVYRHGDRSPVSSYPYNPNPTNTTWPNGLGWLTKEGMKMHYSLGRFFRRHYDGFLSEMYKHTEIEVLSSNIDRCLLSADSNLAGLYPPSGDQVWNNNIPWQPIPVQTRPEDRLLHMNEPCPMYDKLYNDALASKPVMDQDAENRDFYDFIAEKTGNPHQDIDNIWFVADNMYCEQQHNIPWAPWMNMTTFDKLRDVEAQSYSLKYGDKLSLFKGGPLLKDWILKTKKKTVDNSYSIKMNMYSAHDSTVVAILSALRLHNNLNPPYTASVIMELHQGSTGSYYVQLYYRNMTSQDPNDDTDPYELTLPGCDFQCPFDKFVSLTKDDIPTDWDAECALETSSLSMPTVEVLKTSSLSMPTVEVLKTTKRTLETSTIGVTEHTEYKTAFIASVAVYSGVLLVLCVVVMVTCFKYRQRPKESNPC